MICEGTELERKISTFEMRLLSNMAASASQICDKVVAGSKLLDT